ncbi:MAG: hypothetical protein C0506_02170 [Anaerolinea sp.]|nr:hypothetical protein [Anaerolinea sp.]
MEGKAMLRQQTQAMHNYMEAAIVDCTPGVLGKRLPGATINSAGAIYAHTIFSEDGILNGLVRGTTPVYYADGWAQKIGIDMPKGGMEPDWDVNLDLELFRQYAAAVYRHTDEYLASATDAELARVVEPGFVPALAVSALFADVLVWHAATHQGEISALKGVQGVNGLAAPH